MADGDNKAHSSVWQDLYGATFAQRFIDAGGIRTRVLHAGEAGRPPLILIHGTGGHAEAYVRNLAAHGERFDTYAIDLIGHGLSAKPEGRYEIADYVDHVRCVMDALGLERASLSGESLGGWVAARFALAYPDRVERLVLNTTGGATLDLAVMARIAELTMAAVSDPTWERIKARLEWLMADPSRVADDMVACRQRIYRQPGMIEVTRRILCLQDPEIRQRNNLTEAEWSAIQAPTLVLWTSHDPTAAATVGQRIARLIPGVRFEIMDGCGHWDLLALNPAWDREVLGLLRDGRFDAIDAFSDDWITAEGGRGGHEIRAWIAAFGCLAAFGPYEADISCYQAIPQWIAGFGMMRARPKQEGSRRAA